MPDVRVPKRLYRLSAAQRSALEALAQDRVVVRWYAGSIRIMPRLRGIKDLEIPLRQATLLSLIGRGAVEEEPLSWNCLDYRLGKCPRTYRITAEGRKEIA